MSTLYTPQLTDSAILQDDRQRWRTLCMDCRIWDMPPQQLSQFVPQWKEVKFDRANSQILPPAMGIYMFVLKPQNEGLANFHHKYILYIGQTVNLQQRFNQYFSYKGSDEPSDQLKRIMILLWQDRLSFNYFETPSFTADKLTSVEFDLIDMIVPPMNHRFRADGIKQNVKFYSPR